MWCPHHQRHCQKSPEGRPQDLSRGVSLGRGSRGWAASRPGERGSGRPVLSRQDAVSKAPQDEQDVRHALAVSTLFSCGLGRRGRRSEDKLAQASASEWVRNPAPTEPPGSPRFPGHHQ